MHCSAIYTRAGDMHTVTNQHGCILVSGTLPWLRSLLRVSSCLESGEPPLLHCQWHGCSASHTIRCIQCNAEAIQPYLPYLPSDATWTCWECCGVLHTTIEIRHHWMRARLLNCSQDTNTCLPALVHMAAGRPRRTANDMHTHAIDSWVAVHHAQDIKTCMHRCTCERQAVQAKGLDELPLVDYTHVLCGTPGSYLAPILWVICGFHICICNIVGAAAQL